MVVCGGLWWFAVICGGLSFSHTWLERWQLAKAWTGDRTVPAGFESRFGNFEYIDRIHMVYYSKISVLV